MMQPEKGLENFFWRLSSMNINTLEENNVKGFAKKTESGRRDEKLPQLTIYTLKEVAAKIFVRKLAKGENFQN
jgi:hypothetical protein